MLPDAQIGGVHAGGQTGRRAAQGRRDRKPFNDGENTHDFDGAGVATATVVHVLQAAAHTAKIFASLQ